MLIGDGIPVAEKPLNQSLTDLIEGIDTAVRVGAARAHCNVLEELAKIKPVKIGDVELPAASLMPRDLFQSKALKMEFDVWLTNDGVSLEKRRRPCAGGSKGKLVIEWEAVLAPEATALVRTKAEHLVAAKE